MQIGAKDATDSVASFSPESHKVSIHYTFYQTVHTSYLSGTHVNYKIKTTCTLKRLTVHSIISFVLMGDFLTKLVRRSFHPLRHWIAFLPRRP